MGDAGLVLGFLAGFGVVYTIVLLIFGKSAEATPRPDLDGEEAKK